VWGGTGYTNPPLPDQPPLQSFNYNGHARVFENNPLLKADWEPGKGVHKENAVNYREGLPWHV